MRGKLIVTHLECQHCGKDALGSNPDPFPLFTGESQPYVEEEQKLEMKCATCQKTFTLKVKFTINTDE